MFELNIKDLDGSTKLMFAMPNTTVRLLMFKTQELGHTLIKHSTKKDIK